MNVAQLQRIMPRAPAAWLVELAQRMPRWGIDTPREVASFLAQIAHESAELNRLQEDLNYSAPRLMQIWPHHFATLELAEPYAHQPEKLANFVYDDANRPPNRRLGNNVPGDGWRFRGRGAIQITGRNNYKACSEGIPDPVLETPDLLLSARVGTIAACWFWRARGLDLLDDDDDVRAETRVVNGGALGLAQRQAYFNKAMAILNEEAA